MNTCEDMLKQLRIGIEEIHEREEKRYLAMLDILSELESKSDKGGVDRRVLEEIVEILEQANLLKDGNTGKNDYTTGYNYDKNKYLQPLETKVVERSENIDHESISSKINNYYHDNINVETSKVNRVNNAAEESSNKYAKLVDKFMREYENNYDYEKLEVSSKFTGALSRINENNIHLNDYPDKHNITLKKSLNANYFYNAYGIENTKDYFFIVPKKWFQANPSSLIKSAFTVFFEFPENRIEGNKSPILIRPALVRIDKDTGEFKLYKDEKGRAFKGEVTF